MTNHENAQHQPNTGETDQAHESGWIAAVRKRGAEFLKLTKGSLHTARMIHRHGLPLPPYREEGQPATSEEMKVLNNVLSTVAARAETAAAPTHTATAHDSIDPLHHEAVLIHKSDTQDDTRSPKTGFHYGGEFIQARPFQHMLRKPETNQRSTITSPED